MLFPETVGLTRECRARGLHITIETAGTVYQPVDCDLMSISPKLKNSTPWEEASGRWAEAHERLRRQPEVARRLMDAYQYQLKFVVCAPEEINEVAAWVADTGAERERVLLMPEGVDPESLRERGRWLVEVCKAEGFRYCPRLHVELYGSRRGV